MKISSIANYNYVQGLNQVRKNKTINFSAMTEQQREQNNDLRVFYHHIYEYQKGLRNLILTTEKEKHREAIERHLDMRYIDYMVQDIGNDKINVFFGNPSCIEVVKTFGKNRLNQLTPEQDFMLGIMLGYDRVKQCDRYLQTKSGKIKLSTPTE